MVPYLAPAPKYGVLVGGRGYMAAGADVALAPGNSARWPCILPQLGRYSTYLPCRFQLFDGLCFPRAFSTWDLLVCQACTLGTISDVVPGVIAVVPASP